MSSDDQRDPLHVISALRFLAGVEALAAELAAIDVPVLVLKGPHVQRRLLGSPAAYLSADADVLVPRRHAQATRHLMASAGWQFAEENGTLWRLDGAAAYGRANVVVDLHWGLHAGLLPARALRPLESEMWRTAEPIAPNLLQPSLETLLAYLAIHNHASLDRADKMGLLAAAAIGARTETALDLAERCRLRATAEAVINATKGTLPTAPIDPIRERYGPLAPLAVGWRRLPARVRQLRRN